MKTLRFILLLTVLTGALQAARTFPNDLTKYIQLNTTPVTTAPMTFSAWVKFSSTVTGQILFMVAESTVNAHALWLGTTTNALEAGEWDGGPVARAQSGTISTGVWYHAGGVFTSLSSRAVFLDGVKTTNTTTIGSVHTPGKVVVGRWDGAGSALQGDLAEIAIWNVALTDAEMSTLATGVSALRVRPSALVLYIPLWDSVFDYKASRAITTNTTTTTVSGPRRYR